MKILKPIAHLKRLLRIRKDRNTMYIEIKSRSCSSAVGY